MLIEFIFDQLHPRRVPAFEAAFLESLPARAALSPLRGFWKTDVGAIDQVVHLWTYDTPAQRDGVAAAAQALPACAADLIQETHGMLLQAAPFSPPPGPRTLGRVYELRIYDYETDCIPSVIDAWQEKIEARTRLSPLVLCGYRPHGHISQWVHLWAYENAVERQRIRAESLTLKIWPPAATTGLIRQRNMILLPSAFSPLD